MPHGDRCCSHGSWHWQRDNSSGGRPCRPHGDRCWSLRWHSRISSGHEDLRRGCTAAAANTSTSSSHWQRANSSGGRECRPHGDRCWWHYRISSEYRRGCTAAAANTSTISSTSSSHWQRANSSGGRECRPHGDRCWWHYTRRISSGHEYRRGCTAAAANTSTISSPASVPRHGRRGSAHRAMHGRRGVE